MEFPAEIVHHILDELLSEHRVLDSLNDKGPLNNLWKAILRSSTVSHSFRDYLLPQIFREVQCATQERIQGLYSIMTINPTLPSYIKTFHFPQSPPRVSSWLDVVEWTSPSHWVFMEPLLPQVFHLLPHLEVLILEVIQHRGIPGARWSRWPMVLQQSIENIIRGGKLKVARFSWSMNFPDQLLHALVDNVPHLHVLDNSAGYSRFAPMIFPSPGVSGTTAASSRTLDIPFSQGHHIPKWFLLDNIEGHSNVRHLKHLIVRHSGNSLPDQEQQEDMYHFRQRLRNATNLEQLSMLIDNTESARAYIAGSYRMFFESSSDFLLGELASVRHVDLVLPLHFSIGRYNSAVPFPGPICEIFRDKTDGSHPSRLETVVIKITVTPILLSSARGTPLILRGALEESSWTTFEQKLCSTATFPHLHTCVLDVSILTQLGLNVDLGAMMRPKFSQLASRGVTFRLVL